MLRELPNTVTAYSGTVGTTAASLVFADGDGTTHVTVKNTDATNTLYVGWSSSLDTTVATTYFIGGSLATAATLTLADYQGPIYLRADGANTDYQVERRHRASG